MERQALVCPVCGAPYRKIVPTNTAQVRCSYCCATISVPSSADRCPNHPDVLATAVCNDCYGGFCRDCLTPYEVKGSDEIGVLQLCPACLSRRYLDIATRNVLVGLLLAVMGVFVMFFSPVGGLLWIGVFAVPTILYGVYRSRRLPRGDLSAPTDYAMARGEMRSRTAHETYQEVLTEFVKSFGMTHGSMMLENRIKAYMESGLSREEAILAFAEDEGY